MRLKSKSALTWTREWPGPTTEDTIDSTCSRRCFSNDGLPLVGADIAAVGIVGGAVGEQLAALVDDRDALRPQPVDRGGDQMADGAHLRRFERAAHLEHDRGRRLDLVAREQRPFGHHQMHARGLDAVERLDGAGQLAFERPQIIDVLHEARGAERVRLVENLVADAAALGQAVFGQRHAQPRDAVARHHDDIAVVAQFVGDAFAIELLDDGGGIFQRQVGEQRRHLRRGHPQHQEGEEADQGDGDGAHRGDARGAERFDELDQTLHRAFPQACRQEPAAKSDALAFHPARFARWMVSARLINWPEGRQPTQVRKKSRARIRNAGRMRPALSEFGNAD